MANPVELLHCAAENKKRRPAKPSGENVEKSGAATENIPVPPRILYPVHSGHSAYSALMRSHDRVRPRIGR